MVARHFYKTWSASVPHLTIRAIRVVHDFMATFKLQIFSFRVDQTLRD